MSQQTIASKVPLETRSFNTRKANYRADYSTLVVPEHRGSTTARSISLPLIRIRSPHPHPAQPVFWLAGGPGMSNLSYKPPDWLLANHDVVLLGYRGVDGSVALESLEITRAFRKTGRELLSDQSLRNFHNAFAQTYQRIRS